MEEYKGYYIEERWAAHDTLVPTEYVVYENQEKITRGDYIQVFDSVDSAKNWIDTQPSRNYNLTAIGFDVMEVLSVFNKHLGAYGPSPVEVEISEEEMKEGVVAWYVKDNLPSILQQMVSMGLIYKS